MSSLLNAYRYPCSMCAIGILGLATSASIAPSTNKKSKDDIVDFERFLQKGWERTDICSHVKSTHPCNSSVSNQMLFDKYNDKRSDTIFPGMKRNRLSVGFNQNQIEQKYLPSNRSDIISWIFISVRVMGKLPNTSFKAGRIYDAFLSECYARPHHLGLIGTACLVIAIKMVYRYSYNREQLIYKIGLNTTIKELVSVEELILSVLKLKLYIPNSYEQLQLQNSFCHQPDEIFTTAQLLLELVLLSPLSIMIPSNLLAKASLQASQSIYPISVNDSPDPQHSGPALLNIDQFLTETLHFILNHTKYAEPYFDNPECIQYMKKIQLSLQ